MKTFVIAGSYQQFKHYYPQIDRDIVYVPQGCYEKVLGHKNWELKKVGTWYDNDTKFIDKIELEHKLAQR